MQLLISDTNILIDMEEGGLLSDVFLLPYQLCVPDILYYEELEEQHAHLLDLGLTLLEISGNSLMTLELLKSIYHKPSTNDLLAMLLAKQEKCPLLSGDKDLRAAAKMEAVEVRGTLWLVEEMVRLDIITKVAASESYKRMEASGRRLPWTQAHRRLNEL